jgi:hypothetical protein
MPVKHSISTDAVLRLKTKYKNVFTKIHIIKSPRQREQGFVCVVLGFLFCFVVVVVFDTDFHYVAQAGLEFTILLPQSLSAGNTDVCYHTWLNKEL